MTQKSKRPLAEFAFRLPLMMTCEAFEAFIDDYLDGELRGKQKFVFETHLKLCRECKEYLEEYAATIRLAKQQATPTSAGIEMDDVPEDLINAILAAKANAD